MASVFSYYAVYFPYSSDPHDQLTQSPCASHGFHFPHYIPDSSLTVQLIHSPIAMIVSPIICNSHHPFMELRRMTPTCP